MTETRTPARTPARTRARTQQWTFLTNHAHVLLCLARDPDMRLRDVAVAVGITERAVQAIVADLEQGGYVARCRVGRRNHYELNEHGLFRHPLEHEHEVGELLDLLARPARPRSADRGEDPGDEPAGRTPDPGRGGA